MIRWLNSESDRRRAENCVRSAVSSIEQSNRPGIHFHPPAGWMSDPNGPLVVDERYHLFYQHNPCSDRWGNIHWGHACSDDMLNWSHLPIALAPNKEAGLEHCFSGTCVRRSDGKYLVLFTAISDEHGMGVQRGAEQWGALADKGLQDWKPIKKALLKEKVHEKPVFEWRDPYCFHHDGRVFMLLGGNENDPKLKGRPGVFLYEAKNNALLSWEYKGILFHHEDKSLRSVECPVFFQLEDRWVLVLSPYGPVEWYTGIFNPDRNSDVLFDVENTGHIDGLGNHYASTIVGGDIKKIILLGWVGGFPEQLGWNGVLALPRQLAIRNKRLFQCPGVDLGQLVRHSWNILQEDAICSNIFRLRLEVKEIRKNITLPIKKLDGTVVESLTMGPGFVSMAGHHIDFENSNAVVSNVIIDRRMTEIFTDTGECVTFVHELLPPSIRINCERNPDANFTVIVDDLKSIS